MEPQPLPLDLTASGTTAPGGTGRVSLYHRLLHMPSGLPTHYRRPESIRRQASVGTTTTNGSLRRRAGTGHSQNHSLVRTSDGNTIRAAPGAHDQYQHSPPSHITLPPSPTLTRRMGNLPSGVGYTPIIEHVSRATKAAVEPMAMNLPPPTMTIPDANSTQGGQTRLNISTDEFTRAVAVATVSALRQGAAADAAAGHARRAAAHPVSGAYDGHHSAVGGGGDHGGHDAPSWSRGTSAAVLLSCTLLYALIAGTFLTRNMTVVLTITLEILVDVVDVVLKGSGIDEKLLGVTLFALVPNTTEFMNAMSFALNGNISLRCALSCGLYINTNDLTVWKLDQLMLSRFAFCRSLLWSRSPPGMILDTWEPWQIPLREFEVILFVPSNSRLVSFSLAGMSSPLSSPSSY